MPSIASSQLNWLCSIQTFAVQRTHRRRWASVAIGGLVSQGISYPAEPAQAKHR
jgi:hypothetical protein